jgi:hypothetical protein
MSENVDTVVAYDCSLSTSNYDFYHSETQNIVRTLDTSKKTQFIMWDTNHTIISKEKLEFINKNKQGYGGTNPVSLFKYIKEMNFHGDLIFISDGQIPNQCSQICSDILLNWKFNNVYVHLIYTGGIINESVSCAITRSSPHTIKIYQYGSFHLPITTIVSDNDFKYANDIESIDTIDEFLERKKNLENVFVSLNMGTTGNKSLHSKLVNLKNKLTKSESKSFSKDANNPVSKLIDSFKNNNMSVGDLDNVWKLYYKIEDSDENWTKTIDKFISWSSGSLLSSFDRSKITNREALSVKEAIVPSENVAILEDELEDLKLTCPITLSDSSNMILLMKKNNGASIFDELETKTRDSLINCPLNALSNNNIILYIKSLLDCVISIEAYKELVEYGISDKSPLTRDEIFGGLCLGKDESHVKTTNSTLRYVLTDGKSLGNIDLWFAVIYFVIEKGYVEHLNEYLPMVKDHLKYRLINSKSYMCLSGLPTYPTYLVPLGLSLWCSVMATTSKMNLIKNPKNDPIRLHLSYSYELVKLLSMIDVSVPHELLKHIDRLKTLRYFLLSVKKGKENTFKLTNLVNALYYNAIETSDMWVLIDGEPSDLQICKVRSQFPNFCQSLSNTEIKDILDLCDSNKSESDIFIDYNYSIKPYNKTFTKTWSFGNNIPYIKVSICPKTCRPYYTIIDNGKEKTWIQKANEIYGKQLFSTNNFFGNYIFYRKKYPTKSEFLIYLFMYHYSRDIKTLPLCINQFVDIVFDEYEHTINTIDPLLFAELWNRSIHKHLRIQMEKEVN